MTGNSDPTSMIRRWTKRLGEAEDRRHRKELTAIDVENAQGWMNLRPGMLKEAGKRLYYEAKAQIAYAKKCQS